MTTTARAHEPTHDLPQPHRRIWNDVPSLATANELSGRSLIGHLGIEFIEVGDDYLIARMPVDNRTRQPLGLLHGGASVTLAETLASWAAILTIDHHQATCVGMEVNANHIRSVASGWVTGVVGARRRCLGRRGDRLCSAVDVPLGGLALGEIAERHRVMAGYNQHIAG